MKLSSKPPQSAQDIADRRGGQAFGRAVVDIAGRKPRTRSEAGLRADGGADIDTAAATSIDATVGFLLNRDSLNVGQLRT